MIRIKAKWFTSPVTIIGGIIIGLLIGTYNKPLADQLAPIGKLYLALLGMCILPIIITAVVSSIGKFLHNEYIAGFMKRLFLTLLGGLIIASLCGIIFTSLVKPGENLSGAGKALLSSKVADQKTNAPTVTDSGDFVDFLFRIVPTNIFNALSQGNTLAVVFFAILLGIALGKITTEESKQALAITNVIYTALLRIVVWIMYALPFGLCFIFTGYAAQISWGEMAILGSLIAVIYGSAIVLVLLCSLLIWWKSRVSYLRAFSAVKTPLLVAFGSCSSFAAIPAIIYSLEQRLHLERGFAELIVPLGVNLFRQGTVLQFVIVSLFIAQVYGQPLTLVQFGILAFASILTSLAVSGMPGIASAAIFALILDPLGLPSSVGIILFIMILPITDPIITLLNVQGNCTVAMLMRPAKT